MKRLKIKKNNSYLIDYNDDKGNSTTRLITVHTKPKRLSLVIEAFCHLRKAPRKFRADRLTSVVRVKIVERLL